MALMVSVKTTLEIPDPVYRRLKAAASRQGRTVRALVNDAVLEKLESAAGRTAGPPAWRRAFGGLKHLRKETRRIDRVVEAEFSSVDPAAWS